MRFLVVCVLVVFTAPVYAADKEEEKAKAVLGEFLKALKAKDIDALMKTVDVPFGDNVGLEPINKPEKLKERCELLLKIMIPEKIMSYEVGKVYDMAGIAKYAKENKEEKLAEHAEKLVGKTGYMVMIVDKGKESHSVLVRLKDGKAFVAGLLN